MTTPGDYCRKSQRYLKTLCNVRPNRRTGSPGNREATDFFADTIRAYGYEVDATPFECLDYISDGSVLTRGEEVFEVYVSPYSLGCDVLAEELLDDQPPDHVLELTRLSRLEFGIVSF